MNMRTEADAGLEARRARMTVLHLPRHPPQRWSSLPATAESLPPHQPSCTLHSIAVAVLAEGVAAAGAALAAGAGAGAGAGRAVPIVCVAVPLQRWNPGDSLPPCQSSPSLPLRLPPPLLLYVPAALR